MIVGLFAFLVAQLGVLLACCGILRKVRTGTPHVDGVQFLLLRLVLMSAAILVAGGLGSLNPVALGAAGAVATAFGILRGWYRPLFAFRAPKVGWILGSFAGIIFLRLLVQTWFFAPHIGDVLTYHLPKVAEWTRSGRLGTELGLDNHATFPAGFELVEVWWVLFWHHDVLLEMAGVEFLALIGASVYSMARTLGSGGPGAALAALVAVLAPGLHHQATSCMNDAPVAALYVAAAALLVARSADSIVLVAIGLGLGVKPTFAYALPGLLLLRVFVRRMPPVLPPSPWTARAVGGAAVALGLFWYVRNLVLFGNPIHPVGSSGLVDETGQLWIQSGPRFASFWDNLRTLADDRIYDPDRATGALLDHVAGWGPGPFACGLPAILVLAVREVSFRQLLAAGLVSLTTTLFLVKPDPWCLRFILFVPALLAVAAARLAEIAPATRIAVGTALFIQFLATFLPAELPGPEFLKLAKQPWSTRARVDLFPSGAEVTTVGAFGGNLAETYLLYGPNYARDVRYLRSRSAEELRADLIRESLRWLYAVPFTASQRRTIEDSCALGFLRKVSDRMYLVELAP